MAMFSKPRELFQIQEKNPYDFQSLGGVKEVKEIKGADHMAMFSKPREPCCCLLEIANKHT
ncbi:hypothetical protein CsSME_00003813 [Camellia sinensis var. sinensis]